MALVALLAAVLRPAVRADAGGCRCRGAHQAGVKLGWCGGEVCALHPRAASFPAASVVWVLIMLVVRVLIMLVVRVLTMLVV